MWRGVLRLLTRKAHSILAVDRHVALIAVRDRMILVGDNGVQHATDYSGAATRGDGNSRRQPFFNCELGSVLRSNQQTACFDESFEIRDAGKTEPRPHVVGSHPICRDSA